MSGKTYIGPIQAGTKWYTSEGQNVHIYAQRNALQ